MNNKERYGQFFTPDNIVNQMIGLIQNKGIILEPSVGTGAFYNKIPNCIGIEIDKDIAPMGCHVMDFFLWDKKVDTIIGNPPYVKYQDIDISTKKLLPSILDKRSNLYLFFIWRCIDLLNDGGELIFIVPRDFIKTTGAALLNKRLYEEGGFSYWHEFGDDKVFADASPNVVIFRWVKKRAHSIPVKYTNGYLMFSDNIKGEPLSELFDIYVGGVSGMNNIFYNKFGNIDVVVSSTKATGLTQRAHYYTNPPSQLIQYKDLLLKRKIRKFDDTNWWEWGRNFQDIGNNKIYVNCKTRDPQPFFTNASNYFDGSLLALVPKTNKYTIQELIDRLNHNNWEEQGFKVGGRFIFGQKSLLNAVLKI